MTGRMSELDELGGGDGGRFAAANVPQFGNRDGARVAANAEKRIIAYVQTWRQIRQLRLRARNDRRAPGTRHDEARAADIGEGAWVGRCDRANEVVDALGRL